MKFTIAALAVTALLLVRRIYTNTAADGALKVVALMVLLVSMGILMTAHYILFGRLY